MSFTQEDMPSIREGLHRALLSLQEHVGKTSKPLIAWVVQVVPDNVLIWASVVLL